MNAIETGKYDPALPLAFKISRVPSNKFAELPVNLIMAAYPMVLHRLDML